MQRRPHRAVELLQLGEQRRVAALRRVQRVLLCPVDALHLIAAAGVGFGLRGLGWGGSRVGRSRRCRTGPISQSPTKLRSAAGS